MTATVIQFADRRPPLMTPEERDRALHAELRRARIRIRQLEIGLAEALRDALAQHDRARAAERRLAELSAGPSPVV